MNDGWVGFVDVIDGCEFVFVVIVWIYVGVGVLGVKWIFCDFVCDDFEIIVGWLLMECVIFCVLCFGLW